MLCAACVFVLLSTLSAGRDGSDCWMGWGVRPLMGRVSEQVPAAPCCVRLVPFLFPFGDHTVEASSRQVKSLWGISYSSLPSPLS